MELDITHMINDADNMPMLSGSIAELGDDAGRITWNNSKKYAEAHPLLNTPEQIQEAKDYFASFGAWDKEEIESWDNATVQALVVQEIASYIREMEHFNTEEEYFKAAEDGHVSGCLYKTDDNRWIAYLGN